MKDHQILHLLYVLQQHSCIIWALNIGETYDIQPKTWKAFMNGLKYTNITHMYASEHMIGKEIKVGMMDIIRDNRKKHTMHNDPDNIDVIKQCINLWWNPINGLKKLNNVRKNEEKVAPSAITSSTARKPTPDERDKFEQDNQHKQRKEHKQHKQQHRQSVTDLETDFIMNETENTFCLPDSTIGYNEREVNNIGIYVTVLFVFFYIFFLLFLISFFVLYSNRSKECT